MSSKFRPLTPFTVQCIVTVHLNVDSAKLLATALCPVATDFFLVIHLYGITDIDLTRLHMFRIEWPAWWQSPPFSCSVPLLRSLHWLLVRFEYSSRLICWPTKPCVKNSLHIFTPCLPHHSQPAHWDRTRIIACQSLGSRPKQVQ